MNPVFYIGCFIGMCVIPVLGLLRSVFDYFTDISRRELADADARFEKAARDRDEWKRKCDAAAEATPPQVHDSTLPDPFRHRPQKTSP